MQNRRLINQSRVAGLMLPLTILFGFIAGALIILQAYLLSGVISGVFIDRQTLLQVMPVLRSILVVVIVRVIFTIVNETLAGVLAVRVKTHLRNEMLNKINRLGPAFLKGERTADLTNTALQGLDALDAYFGQFLPQILLAVMLPMTILLVVFPLDWVTGIVFLITAPLIPLFMVLIGRLSENQTRKQWKALSRLAAYFLDTLQGLNTLLILGKSKDRLKELRGVSDRYRTATMNVLKITFLSAFVLELIAMTATAVVAVEIGFRLLYSQILFRQAFFILLIAPEFYLPMRNLSARFHAGMNGLSASKKVFELFDLLEPAKNQNEKTGKIGNPFQASFSVEFSSVSYMYPGNAQNALANLNFEIKSGKHYAVIGTSGTGKSTLANLLLRFIDPTDGMILIDGEEINQWNPSDWRRWISWVPQKPMIFNTSILENVRLGDNRYSTAQVELALERAQLSKFVNRSANGLLTQVQEAGFRLSGGEAQRIALARALLKECPLVLMDEPTAHLDIELEKEFGIAVKELLAGQTSITIAHRLPTIQQADEVIVLSHGKLVDRGHHEELLVRCPEYASLITEIEVLI